MNWNKIKIMLIFVFIILNVALWYLIDSREKRNYTLSLEQQKEINEIFKDHMSIYCMLPDYYPLSKLKIEYEQVDEEKLVNNIFNEKENVKYSIDKDKITYTIGTENLEINKGNEKGLVRYKNPAGKYKMTLFTQKEAEKIATSFVKNINYSGAKMQLIGRIITDESYIFEFFEKFNGNLFFGNYVKVKVTEKGVVQGEARRYKPLKIIDEKRYVYPPDEALYNFMQYYKQQTDELITVKEMNIGYNLGDYSIEEDGSAVALPYYRIRLGDGQVYYINAYKNEIKES